MKKYIEGKIVDIQQQCIYQGTLTIEAGKITAICKGSLATDHPCTQYTTGYIMPGFIDAHVHIESAMLTPENFGEVVITKGTVAVVTDPHEIANVLGVAGIQFMLDNSKKSPIKTFFTIPSCVPATPFDVSGGRVSAAEVEQLAATKQFVGLSEMMNVPGVLFQDKEVMAKLHTAQKYGYPIDGHAPLLSGENLKKYTEAQITTDHECSTIEEAEEKIKRGMKILIREGSAARNYEALKTLIKTHPEATMFCTDDSHPDELLSKGHIDKIVRQALRDGFNLFDVLRIASLNPIHHYGLNVGQLREGDEADFIVVDNLADFNTRAVYICGKKCYTTKESATKKEIVSGLNEEEKEGLHLNFFNHAEIQVEALRKEMRKATPVIEVKDGELVTQLYTYTPSVETANLEAVIKKDILKIVYLNRYTNGTPQVAFCKGFNLTKGAFASCIAHDSHNIIAVGCTDADLCKAINQVIKQKGGLAVSQADKVDSLSLPIGGIMSDHKAPYVAEQYSKLNRLLAGMGCTLRAPFMTLSFLSLVVIPSIKIGEKGLFLYDQMNWVEEC